MGKLDPKQLRSRLAFDHRVATSLVSPALGPVTAYTSADAGGREVSPEEGAAGAATCFVVEYRFPVLAGAGKHTPVTRVRFDLLAGGNYPFSAPVPQVLSRPLPWSPHVHPANGFVCLGAGWARARGRMLLGELIVHVMRILNCDEPDRGPDYVGWNADAIRYWRTVLGRKPLHPDLAYPDLPAEVTHGVTDPATAFTPVVCSALVDANEAFVPAADLFVADDAVFAPIGGDG